MLEINFAEDHEHIEHEFLTGFKVHSLVHEHKKKK